MVHHRSAGRDQTLAKLLGILGDVGYPLPDDARILDLGCGNGDSVQALRERGHEAFGCDFQFKEGPHRERLERQSPARSITPSSTTTAPAQRAARSPDEQPNILDI